MTQRIMIVDDEASFGEIGEIILARAGYEVRRFESAADALKDLSAFRPDLVLSDAEMPGMSGFDFLRAVRKIADFKDTPFIFTSSSGTPPVDRTQGLEVGADHHVTKPFSGDELVQRVKAVLRLTGHEPTPAPPEAAQVPPPPVAVETPNIDAYLKQLGALPSPAPKAAPKEEHASSALDPLSIFQELRRRLAAEEPAAILLTDLSFFRRYNECYGFEKGDEVLRFVLKCLEGAIQRVGETGDILSHLYADEFLILTTPVRAPLMAQAALFEFSHGVLSFYTEGDLNRGFMESKNRMGRTVATPFLNLTSAVVSNGGRKLTHPGQFIHIGRELLAYAKTLGGSRYVQDRRHDPGPGKP